MMDKICGSHDPIETGAPQAGSLIRSEDLYSVLLFDDDVHDREYVTVCLMQVFDHPLALARKIMLEADRVGKALAEVEEALAREHCAQLRACGLTADIEKSVA